MSDKITYISSSRQQVNPGGIICALGHYQKCNSITKNCSSNVVYPASEIAVGPVWGISTFLLLRILEGAVSSRNQFVNESKLKNVKPPCMSAWELSKQYVALMNEIVIGKWLTLHMMIHITSSPQHSYSYEGEASIWSKAIGSCILNTLTESNQEEGKTTQQNDSFISWRLGYPVQQNDSILNTLNVCFHKYSNNTTKKP